jgi:type VI secretion system protein ImpL
MLPYPRIFGYSLFFVFEALVSWWSGSALGLTGQKLMVFRGLMIFLGAVGIGAFAFWKSHKDKAKELLVRAQGQDPSAAAAAGDSADVNFLIADAESKLAAAQVEKGVKLGTLPQIYIVGDTGAAKTSSVINSAIDAELLAGQVYQETNVIATRAANIWYAQKAVFVEAAGKAVNDPAMWTQIVKRLQPGKFGSAVANAAHPPRAALVTVEAEALMRPGASESLAAMARTLRSRLGEISQTLGINLPVYVLFTKMDRVPFFAEFVRNLTNEEAAQVLGVTVPIETARTGVYAETETARLMGVFEQLFRSLCNARPWLLSREHEAPKLPPCYEFPREFRKLRPNLVQFLTDLCRPSQLTVSPFLRGFYFSGVRPVVVQDVTPGRMAPQPMAQGSGVTGMFNAGAFQAAPVPQQVIGSKRVPQWIFLPHFFHRVLLGDRSAQGASGASATTSSLRRILFATAAGLCLIYTALATMSYFNNRALETEARDAARGIETVQGSTTQVASLDSLKRLEVLRQSLEKLIAYNESTPLSYRWGLYIGHELYPEVRRLYFNCFKRVMFGQTQTTLLDTMRTLPAVPGPEYQPTYETLKAYLITTSNHDKSTREFLSPVLMNRWSTNKNVDSDRMQLAQKQFDFYSTELKAENPYSSDREEETVKKARDYLHQFEGIERVYAAMLADASKKSKNVNFNKMFPDTVGVVSDGYEVIGPFTKPGYDFMKTAFKNPTQYFNGEEWVLGPAAPTKDSVGSLTEKLKTRYITDYKKQWRNYMRSAIVGRYANLADASKKLGTLSSNSSPLLALISLASQNTDVDDPEVKGMFQPVQSVVPANMGDHYIGPSNQSYMSALLRLQGSIEQAVAAPQLTDTVAAPTLSAAQDAQTTTRQMAQLFNPDKDTTDPGLHVDAKTRQLLEDPITSVMGFLRGLGPAELNAKGGALCGQWRALMVKYPFNPQSKVDATIPEVNGLFHKPDGSLWAFYDQNLAKYLVKQGADYVPVQGAGITLTPGFVNFFNRSAHFADAIYAGNTADPHINYTLKPLSSEGIKSVRIELDGQTLNYTGGDATPKALVWQGPGTHGVRAFAKLGDLELSWGSYDGLWAIFRFFARADKWEPPQGNPSTLEWFVRIGNDVNTPITGNTPSIKLQLDMAGSPPVFQRGYLSQFGCSADVAKQ